MERTVTGSDACELRVGGVTITVTHSEVDGAMVIFLDTDFEPDGENGEPGLRVWLNEHLLSGRETSDGRQGGMAHDR